MDAPTPPSDNEKGIGFRVPAPPARPGEDPDFANFDKGAPGDIPRFAVDAPVDAFTPYHQKILRVLSDHGQAEGPWAGGIDDAEKKAALVNMIRTRAFDQRMMRAQRQGKTSFYIQCLGEEAIGTGAALSTNITDMHFPTYRQQSILLTRNIDPERMMNQIYSNEQDSLKGKQLPVLYSFREAGFFTLSGNLATQWAQGVGWAMASAIRKDDKVAVAWIGDGATAEGDWHWGNLFAAVYRAPCLLCVVNNQWAISSTNAFAGGDLNSFAARLASYGLPALRVDGNDVLAVVAACRFAVQRARMGLGAVGIEFVTYRGGAHSTSDDPTKYRPKDELSAWPLGDPIERLKQHLIVSDVMSAEEIAIEEKAADTEMREAERRAEAHGLVHDGRGASPATMFDQVYEELPGRLIEQQDDAGF
ncbi:MAG: thiamine pyrophosphate-dependent enzyme [Pseudomonadota bacterium]